MKGELDAPPFARRNGALEIVRIWHSGDDVQVAIRLGPYAKEPAAWGVVVADLVRHLTAAYRSANPHIPSDYIERRIVDALRAEIDVPSEGPEQ